MHIHAGAYAVGTIHLTHCYNVINNLSKKLCVLNLTLKVALSFFSLALGVDHTP